MKGLEALVALCFVISAAAATAAPNGEQFNASAVQPSSQLGSDPSVCNDPTIAQLEQQTGTIARLFPNVVTGGKEGQLGRLLETLPGEVYSAGVCNTRPGASVEFIYKKRIEQANKIAGEMFAGSGPSSTAGSQNAGGLPSQQNYDDTYENVVGSCAVRSQEGQPLPPSCLNPNLVGYCRRKNEQPAGCIAIVAQAETGTKTIPGGITLNAPLESNAETDPRQGERLEGKGKINGLELIVSIGPGWRFGNDISDAKKTAKVYPVNTGTYGKVEGYITAPPVYHQVDIGTQPLTFHVINLWFRNGKHVDLKAGGSGSAEKYTDYNIPIKPVFRGY